MLFDSAYLPIPIAVPLNRISNGTATELTDTVAVDLLYSSPYVNDRLYDAPLDTEKFCE